MYILPLRQTRSYWLGAHVIPTIVPRPVQWFICSDACGKYVAKRSSLLGNGLLGPEALPEVEGDVEDGLGPIINSSSVFQTCDTGDAGP